VAQCTVGYNDTAAGSPTITATYSGDLNNPANTVGTNTVTVSAGPTVSIPVTPLVYDVGQSASSLTATVTNLMQNTPVNWYQSSSSSTCVITGSSLEPGTSFTPPTTIATTTYYCAVVTDSAIPGYSSDSGVVKVTVYTDPTVSVQPIAGTIDAGQTYSLSSTVSGGTGTFSWQWWYNDGGGPISGASCSSSCSETATYAATTTGTYYVIFTDTGVTAGSATTPTANSNHVAVTVNPPPKITLSPSTSTIDAGQSVVFTNTTSLGTPPYTYTYTISPSTGTSRTGNKVRFNSAGTFNVFITVTDSVSGTASSTNSVITVDSPQVAGPLTETNTVIDSGQYSRLTAGTTNGGASPYTINWFTGASCATPLGQSGTSILVKPSTTTIYSFNSVDSSQGGATSVCSASNTVTVNPLPTITLSPSTSTIDAGQSVIFTNTSTGGTRPLVWSYSTNALGAVITGNSIRFPTAGSYAVTEYVQDNAGANVPSTPVLVSVNADPTVSLLSEYPAVDSGQPDTFTATPSGGTVTSGYTYTWTGCKSTTNTCTISPWVGVQTKESVSVKVTDDAPTPITSSSASASVTYNPLPIVLVKSQYLLIDQGQTDVFSATGVPGTGSLTYSWTVPAGLTEGTDCTIPSSNSCTVTGATPFAYLVGVTVTDSSPAGPKTSLPSLAPLAVTPDPTVRASPAGPFTYDVGQSASSLTARVTYLGTGTITVTWYSGTSPTCSLDSSTGITGRSFTPSTTTPGTTYYCAVVSDSNIPTYTSTSTAVEVTVNPIPTVSVSPAVSALDIGQSTLLTATASGGTGTLNYQWMVNEQEVGTNSPTYLFNANSTTQSNDTALVYVTDSAPTPITVAGTTSVSVNADPSVSLNTGNVALDDGQQYTFSATPAYGTGGYTYTWSYGGLTVVSGCDDSATCTIGTTGLNSVNPYTVSVTVTDSAPTPMASSPSTASVTVNPALALPVILTPDVSLEVGQTYQFTITASPGTTPYSYAWTVGSGLASSGSDCTSGASTCTVSATSSGPTAVSVDVTDDSSGTPAATQSSTSTVTVYNLGTPTVSPSSNTLDVGQSVGLVASVTGGTGTYSYQWYLNGNPVGSDSSSYTLNANLTTEGTAAVSVTATDTGTQPGATPQIDGSSVPYSFVVNSALSLQTPTTLTPNVDQGQMATITGTAPTTGTATYTYQWLEEAPGASSYTTATDCAASTTDICAFTTAGSTTGTYSFELEVTDSASTAVTVTSDPVSVTVNPTPTVTLTPSRSLFDSGMTETYSITVNGGTGPFSINLYNITSGAPVLTGLTTTISNPGGTSTISFTVNSPEMGSVFAYEAIATDAGVTPGYIFSSASSSITVNLPPASNVTVVPQEIDVGGDATLTASITYGTAPFTFNYQVYNSMGSLVFNGLSTDVPYSGTCVTGDCVTVNSIIFPSTSNSIGTDSVNVILTDDVGVSETFSNITIVNPQPAITISPSSTSISTGGSVIFTNTTTGGTAPYTFFNYIVNNTSGVTTIGNTITFANAGVYNVIESVTDNVAVTVNSLPVTITVTTPPSPGPGPVNTGGGGGGGGTGGTFLPTVTVYTNGNETGYMITNFSQLNSETLSFNGGAKTLHVTVNFITPSSAGITISNSTTSATYTLTLNNPTLIIDPANYSWYADLTGISYLPIAQTITLLIYEQPNLPHPTTTPVSTPPSPKTTASTTVSTTAPTTAPTTTVSAATPIVQSAAPGKPLSAEVYAIIAGVVVVVALVAAYYGMNRRRQGGRRAK
jgi:hypothetical protein